MTDLTYYRRMQENVDSVGGCGAGEARAPDVLSFSAEPRGALRAAARGDCLRYNATYYGLWGRHDMSMQAFPERGRLHGSMSAATQAANGFTTNKRFAVPTTTEGSGRTIVMVPTYTTRSPLRPDARDAEAGGGP